MGVRQRLTSYAVGGAHVLVVEVPGSWSVRVAVEQAAAARGWRAALSPADADVLVVVGQPGERLTAAIDRVWDQLPGPRSRVAVGNVEAAGAALEEAAGLLRDEDQQRSDARDRAAMPTDGDASDDEGSDEDASDGDASDGGMGDMDMAPAGIPLAGGGADRDGLELDVLHVPLGPVLPHWPAGLVLRCSLNGDVVTGAHAEVLPAVAAPPSPPEQGPSTMAARRCDSAARLLAIAGWDDVAAAARRTRDALLLGRVPTEAVSQLARLQHRVARSWSLRWMLRGLGPIDAATLAEHGLSRDLGGDVHDRLLAMLDRARADLSGAPTEDADPAAVLAAVPALVTGLDLGAARLVVASVDLDTAALRRELTHV